MKFLFASDLDGTLFPNTGAPKAPGCLERTRYLLQRLQEAQIPVCYVTGRHLALGREGIQAFGLPAPDRWVCNVGTEIHDSAGAPDPEWQARLGAPLDRQALLNALADWDGLSLQEKGKQGPHKLSFYYPAPADPEMQESLIRRINQTDKRLQLIASTEEGSGRALLDIVPGRAGKRNAVAYLARRLGVHTQDVFFAGDSGNDLDLLISGVRGTLVGNTPEAVVSQWLRGQTSGSRCYFARASYGDGIIEGMRHYRLWPLPERAQQPKRRQAR